VGGVDVPGIESRGDVGEEVVGGVGVGMPGGVDENASGRSDDVFAGSVDEEVTGRVGDVCEGCLSEEGEPSMAMVQRRRAPRRAACRSVDGWKRGWKGRKKYALVATRQPGGPQN